MEKIAIIGTGLIGASLGLAIKKMGLKDTQVVGVDLERSRAQKAKKMGAVDKAESNLPQAVRDASIVFIATPVLAIKEIMEVIGPRLAEGALVTDTGGTKTQVMDWAKELLPENVDFVGGHPMAGSESRGPDQADASLFEGKPYCIVPKAGASTQGVQTLMDLTSAMGARPFFIDAMEHDSFVAAVSHLPFVLSAALVGAAAKSPQWGDISHLASTGFKDATRLASGDSTMHRDVCITNKEGIIYWMDELIIELERIKYVLRSENNSEELFQLFENAFDEREKWLGGMIKPWSKAEYERPKSPSFNRIFFGDRIAGKLFGEDDGKVGEKKN